MQTFQPQRRLGVAPLRPFFVESSTIRHKEAPKLGLTPMAFDFLDRKLECIGMQVSQVE